MQTTAAGGSDVTQTEAPATDFTVDEEELGADSSVEVIVTDGAVTASPTIGLIILAYIGFCNCGHADFHATHLKNVSFTYIVS